MKVKDYAKKKRYPSLLFYGPAGTSKTALSSQAHNAYCFDFDGGMATAVNLKDKFQSLRYECEFDIYKDANPLIPNAWLKAEKKLEELQIQSAQEKLPFETIIIDSLSGLVKCMQLHVMYVAYQNSFKKPQIQDWGTLVNNTEKVLTMLRSYKCLLIVTAHEINVEVDKRNCIRPLSVTKNHGIDKLAWLFDEVLHFSLEAAGMGKHKYMASGMSTSSILARTRSSLTTKVNVGEIGLGGLLDKIGYKRKE